MIGKIIGTSLAILQFFYMGFNWSFFIVCRICVFGANVGPTAKFLRMEQAQQNSGTAQMYIKELWNLPIASILISFIVYFIGGYFLYSSFMQQLVPLLIKPTHNNFSYPLLCL
jgi:ABC-2 type transport system permease protein